MKKQIIVIPSHDGSEYDLHVLPPDDNIALARGIVDKVVGEVKAELGEDVDGEAGTLIIARLKGFGFVDLELVFAGDNYDS